MEGNLASAQRPQAQPGARRLDQVRAGSAPGPPRVHTGSSPGPPRVRPRSPPECLEGVKGLPHQDGFKARGGILRAAKTHVAQSHVSFQPVSAAPAGLEPVSANRFKARLGPKISQETQGYLISLSVFLLLEAPAPRNGKSSRPAGGTKPTKNSRVSDTLEFFPSF